jgi:hypothetical protein
MKHKWHLFWVVTGLCLLGTVALGYIAYTNAPVNSTKFIEVTKTVFLCLGGLGVILPLYINATNAIEARVGVKIENTFYLIEKWDDPHLLEARKMTRSIRDDRSSLSDNDLIKKINDDANLKQSVVLVGNYFELVRFSIANERIDTKQFKATLGSVIIDIIKRFEPYFKTLGQETVDDLRRLEKMLG